MGYESTSLPPYRLEGLRASPPAVLQIDSSSNERSALEVVQAIESSKHVRPPSADAGEDACGL